MNFPCANPIDCPSTDSPLANLSSEAPDVARFFGFKFNPWGPQLCIADSEAMADICNPPPPFNPPLPVVYSSNAQSCTLDCGDGSTETYTAVTGTFVALSQAEADASAYALACAAAQILCNGGTVTLFYNTAQSCTVPCGNGLTNTYTLEAGLIAGLSLGEANTNAASLACVLATLLCAGRPPVPQGVDGGAGVPPMGGPLFGNSQQSCMFNCAGGGTYNSVVAAGLFTADNRAAANAIAASYACLQANEAQGCLGSLPADSCVAEYYEAEIEFTGLLEPVTWAIISGSLPPGLLTSGGVVAGTPTATGASSFTMRATGADENYSERSYTITAREILPSTLPSGDTSTPYAAALIGDGFTSPVWSVTGGALPDGLALNPNTGVISGTATTSGTFSFTIAVTEGTATCQKDFTIEITGGVVNIAYWNLDDANPLLNLDQVSGDPVNVISNFPFGSASSAQPAVISNGVQWAATVFANGCNGIVYQESNAIAYTGNGLSWAFWIKIDSATVAFGSNVCLFTYYPDIGDVSTYKLEWNCSPVDYFSGAPPGFGNVNLNAATFPLLFPSMDVWHLCVFVMDAAGNLSVSIDASALALLGNGGAIPAQPLATAQLSINLDLVFAGAVGPMYLCDEVALFSGALNDAQVAYLYNAGAGRTYPLTLP